MTRIRIERRGGVAGVCLAGVRELADLTAEQRRALDRIVEHPHVAEHNATHIHPIRYTVVFMAEAGEWKFEVPEEHMPDELASIAERDLR